MLQFPHQIWWRAPSTFHTEISALTYFALLAQGPGQMGLCPGHKKACKSTCLATVKTVQPHKWAHTQNTTSPSSSSTPTSPTTRSEHHKLRAMKMNPTTTPSRSNQCLLHAPHHTQQSPVGNTGRHQQEAIPVCQPPAPLAPQRVHPAEQGCGGSLFIRDCAASHLCSGMQVWWYAVVWQPTGTCLR